VNRVRKAIGRNDKKENWIERGKGEKLTWWSRRAEAVGFDTMAEQVESVDQRERERRKVVMKWVGSIMIHKCVEQGRKEVVVSSDMAYGGKEWNVVVVMNLMVMVMLLLLCLVVLNGS
jgi:hypothetical protein